MLYAALSVVVAILAVSVMRTITELMIVRSKHEKQPGSDRNSAL